MGPFVILLGKEFVGDHQEGETADIIDLQPQVQRRQDGVDGLPLARRGLIEFGFVLHLQQAELHQFLGGTFYGLWRVVLCGFGAVHRFTHRTPVSGQGGRLCVADLIEIGKLLGEFEQRLVVILDHFKAQPFDQRQVTGGKGPGWRRNAARPQSIPSATSRISLSN